MYKIAILGCENTHANNFLDFLIKEGKYPDIEVVGVFSEYEGASEKLAEEYGVYSMKSYDEFVGKVDGVVITARHGDKHYEYAKPYIDSRIPMFIDKPITVTEDDAKAFKAQLVEKAIKVSGGSMCIYADKIQEFKKNVEEKTYGKVFGGFFRSPINMNNEYGNFFFYSQHLVHVMCEVFGYFPKSVIAFENGSIISGIVRYEDYDINIVYTDGYIKYFASIDCENDVICSEYTVDGLAIREFETFYQLLKGGEMKESYDEFFAPVYILNALNRSLTSGKEEIINY